MSNVWVIYETYSKDFQNINNEKYNTHIITTFKKENELMASSYMFMRLNEQCDKIIDNGSLKQLKKGEEWMALTFEDKEEELEYADIYYGKEYQYSIYKKLVELE